MIARQEKPNVDAIPPVAKYAIYKPENPLKNTEIKYTLPKFRCRLIFFFLKLLLNWVHPIKSASPPSEMCV